MRLGWEGFSEEMRDEGHIENVQADAFLPDQSPNQASGSDRPDDLDMSEYVVLSAETVLIERMKDICELQMDINQKVSNRP